MLSDEVAQYITKRAVQSNVLDRIDLNPDEYVSGYSYAQISGIYDGSLDEEFVVGNLYAINVADWLAEFYRDEDDPEAPWEIIVSELLPGALVECAGDDECTEPHDDEIGNLLYRIES